MTETLTATCPACGATLAVPKRARLGDAIECAQCGARGRLAARLVGSEEDAARVAERLDRYVGER